MIQIEKNMIIMEIDQKGIPYGSYAHKENCNFNHIYSVQYGMKQNLISVNVTRL